MTQSESSNGEWRKSVLKQYSQLSDKDKEEFLDEIISISGPSQKFHLSQKLQSLLYRDFVCGLPPELVLQIFQNLDGETALICCQVCKDWNLCLNYLSPFWARQAKLLGAIVPFVKKDKAHLNNSPEHVDSKKPCMKFLYLHTLRTIRGMSSRTSLVLNKRFVESSGSNFRITSLAYHDEKLVTGSDDQIVHIYDIPSGKQLNRVSTHTVCCLTVRNSHLYTASFNANADVWDMTTGHHLKSCCGHTSAVIAIDVTHDERFILTGSVDRTAKLWDLQSSSNMLVKTFASFHEDWVFQVKYIQQFTNELQFITCDSKSFYTWSTKENGEILDSDKIHLEIQSSFTSLYQNTNRKHEFFASLWLEDKRCSQFLSCVVQKKKIVVLQTFELPIAHMKAYVLGAGHRFAILTCFISRKDFHVVDLLHRSVVAVINTPDFSILTRNASAVKLCSTNWLDGLDFDSIQPWAPLFAATVDNNAVMLISWAPFVSLKV